jgi:shikimate dehydrogenase
MRITDINGQTRLIGFFGSTYQTSKMYAMYNAAIQALGLNYVYVPFAVDDLEQAVAGVRHLGVAAIGITIPYKVEIMPYLDELDSDARRIGAVNVVVNRGGRLTGSNTDGRGALRALQEQCEVQQQQITLLGAGGAARAIAFALRDAGGSVTVINRTEQHAHDLAAAVGGDTTGGGMEQLTGALSHSTIVINTTPVGMANTPQEGQSLVPAHLLQPHMTVMDIVSNPRETRLLQDAQQAGCRVVYGYRMLLWQGIDKFRLYTGVEPPIEVMEQAMEQAK